MGGHSAVAGVTTFSSADPLLSPRPVHSAPSPHILQAFVCIYIAAFAATWGPIGEPLVTLLSSLLSATSSPRTAWADRLPPSPPLPTRSLGRDWRDLPSRYPRQGHVDVGRVQLASPTTSPLAVRAGSFKVSSDR